MALRFIWGRNQVNVTTSSLDLVSLVPGVEVAGLVPELSEVLVVPLDAEPSVLPLCPHAAKFAIMNSTARSRQSFFSIVIPPFFLLYIYRFTGK